MHAFIIEDDYLAAEWLQDTLSDLGFSRFSFAKSEDAAILGADEKYDLITADVRLLPGDGIKAVEVIRNVRLTPVIFITGDPAEASERLGTMGRGAAVLSKPTDAHAVATAVKAVLADLQANASD